MRQQSRHPSSVFRLCLATAAMILSAMTHAGPVDINRAKAKEIALELKGVGPALAKAIVSHRRKHGPFQSLDDLDKVKGLGRHVIDRNRANMFVGLGEPDS